MVETIKLKEENMKKIKGNAETHPKMGIIWCVDYKNLQQQAKTS